MAPRDAVDAVIAGGGTKQAIRDAAVQLFATKGFEQTSLREVADMVGITKASLYYHYASKLDLLLAIVDPIIGHVRGIVTDIDAVPYDAEGIRAVLRAYLRGMIRHRDAGAVFVRDAAAVVNAITDRYPDLMEPTMDLRVWLAGPDPDPEAMLRASAAIEVLGVALLSTEVAPGATDALVEKTLLDAATCVLTACGTA
ncbi:TetR/AcrR family transcriptional regulator [Nocardia asteroides]|uniref:TetR family transcriptional regulator n=1 Tax=Nocardia asteroides NBRC 15531 TaxID=1110697 RepID=U5EBU9_NOCAS|nr:TetR/AcrR family transcriptional regulator [Nocardia asteroides]TLF68869.1 TetR/AcrR family transcriptional regulator [Nocardia asteroides NBRC 15531]UGT48336.1 TetR/AcrR family transcriptional regulator [Nocardia asteroides]SFL56121.1 transcriptional regulator, TetR family [Nocardia asteroides]VEG32482.1 HTH-type transcriptional regulator EthR [Nocardia asteroides]GAD84825.1 putative TetR family transcriptional regulator [Nocardia asteroides NBRC 15531]